MQAATTVARLQIRRDDERVNLLSCAGRYGDSARHVEEDGVDRHPNSLSVS